VDVDLVREFVNPSQPDAHVFVEGRFTQEASSDVGVCNPLDASDGGD
jgi:hypothetical protein